MTRVEGGPQQDAIPTSVETPETRQEVSGTGSEWMQGEEARRLERFRDSPRHKVRQLLSAFMFGSAMILGSGEFTDASAGEKNQDVKIEKTETKNPRSINGYFRNEKTVLDDEEAHKKELLSPHLREKVSIPVPIDKFPWIRIEEDGTRKILLSRGLDFDKSISEIRGKDFDIGATPEGRENLSMRFTWNAAYNRLEVDRVIRPEYKNNPDFYRGAQRLLKPQYEMKERRGKYEFVSPVDADELAKKLELHPDLIAQYLVRTADERHAVLRIRAVAESLSLADVVESIDRSLSSDRWNEFFKK